MYLSARALQVRNASIAVINGAITLVILLIAPLGLTAVIINTVLVTIATYTTGTIVDRIVGSIVGSSQSDRPLSPSSTQTELRRSQSRDVDRYR